MEAALCISWVPGRKISQLYRLAWKHLECVLLCSYFICPNTKYIKESISPLNKNSLLSRPSPLRLAGWAANAHLECFPSHSSPRCQQLGTAVGCELLSSWANSNNGTAKGKGIQALLGKNFKSRAGEKGKKIERKQDRKKSPEKVSMEEKCMKFSGEL